MLAIAVRVLRLSSSLKLDKKSRAFAVADVGSFSNWSCSDLMVDRRIGEGDLSAELGSTSVDDLSVVGDFS